MREGGCLCGAVRYRVEGEPEASDICHCETCRRAASAPTLPFAVFPSARFAFRPRAAGRVQVLVPGHADVLRHVRLAAHLSHGRCS